MKKLALVSLCVAVLLSRTAASPSVPTLSDAAEPSYAPPSAGSQKGSLSKTADELVIRRAFIVANAYSASFQNRNMASILAFCSAGLIADASFKQRLADIFKQNSVVRLENAQVRYLASTDDMVLVHEDLEWKMTRAQTGASETFQTSRLLRIIKEQQNWVVSKDISAHSDIDDIASELVASHLEEKEGVFIEPGLSASALVASMINQSNIQYMQKYDYYHAIDAFSWILSFVQQNITQETSGSQSYVNALNWLAYAEVSAGNIAGTQGNKSQSDYLNQDAVRRYLEYLSLVQKDPTLSTPLAIVIVHNELGTAYQGLGQNEQALSFFQLALQEATDQKSMINVRAALSALGILQRATAGTDAELKAYQDYYQQRKQSEDKAAMATVLDLMGAFHHERGNLAEALSDLEEGKQLRTDLDDDSGVADTWMEIGGLHFYAADYDEAQNGYEQARQIYSRTHNNTALSDVWRCLSSVCYRQGNYAQSLEYAFKGLEIAEQQNSLPMITRLYLCIGTSYLAQGDFTQAFSFLQACVQNAAVVNDPVFQNSAMTALSNLFLTQGDYDQALEQMMDADPVMSKVAMPSETITNLSEISSIWFMKGDLTQALAYAQKAVATAEVAGDPTVTASAYQVLGNALVHQGQTDGALAAYKKCLETAQSAKAWSTVAQAYLCIGETLYGKGEYSRAQEQAQQALKVIDPTDLINLWGCHTDLGYSDYCLKQYDDAEKECREAIDSIEKIRSQVAGGAEEEQLFFQHGIRPYRLLIQILLQQHRDAEAFAVMEASRARLLREAFGGRPGSTPLTLDERAQSSRLEAQLASIDRQVETAKRQGASDSALAPLEEMQKRIRLERQLWRTILTDRHTVLSPAHTVQAVGYDAALKLLPSTNAAILEYAVLDNATYVFVLTRQGGQPLHKVYRIGIGVNGLKKLVKQFRDDVAQRDDQPGFYPESQYLYGLLLGGPIESQLKGVSRLCIVPDGPLWDLPFQALLSADGQYVLDSHTVFFTPSLTALREMRVKESHVLAHNYPMLLAVGNPALPTVGRTGLSGQKRKPSSLAEVMGGSFQPLPQAEAQIKDIAAIYGKARCKVLVGESASEDRVKSAMGRYKMLQFATHGVANDVNPLYSFLLLSQNHEGIDEDGMLFATDVMRMRLRAQLVVLAACDTAHGQGSPGEGLIGMTWAFLYAGCPNVVASQWQIDAGPTTSLMVDFHKNLSSSADESADGAAVVNALRDAALKLRRSHIYAHPYYWAPFVLTGDGFGQASVTRLTDRKIPVR